MDQSFIFVGNRFFVLEEMLELGLDVIKILAIKDSYLEKELISRNIKYIAIESKQQLIDEIRSTDFDVFLANGCPYILPISVLKQGDKEFINIHPSFLPDLRGADPQPGALLFGRDSGATCHVMDDGIDTGNIIAQVKIPYSRDLDAALLYQLSFMAEKEVFYKAYANGLGKVSSQRNRGDEIYYSKKEEDLLIDFSKNADEIYRTIKAFSNRSQGAYFIFRGEKFRVYDCEIVENDYLVSKIDDYQDGEVVLNYENKLLIKKDTCYLKLKDIGQSVASIPKGVVLLEIRS